MKLYDTLSAKKREFVPIKGKNVSIYTCGPSVYSYSHIGNFRTYLFEDVLIRYLKFLGFSVKRVMNITDLEDKAIEQAIIENKTLDSLVNDKIEAFLEDFKLLGILKPNKLIRASKKINLMIKAINILIKKGYCIFEKDGIYFDTRKFRKYGELSKIPKVYRGIARKDDYSVEGLWDFRLWKFHSKKDSDIFWKSPFGIGRPGWHIECSTLAHYSFEGTIDIHCGGVDNIFPHHENEIAQSEAAWEIKFANFWLHSKHLTINKRKMSKRTGNVYYVKELQKMGIEPKCLRYYLISERYRNALDFSLKEFKSKICACNEFRELIKKLNKIKKTGKTNNGDYFSELLISCFKKAMDDDLNTKKAIKQLFTNIKKIDIKKLTKSDAKKILKSITKINSVLGII